MRGLRVSVDTLWARPRAKQHDGGVMTTDQFAEHAPDEPHLTAYDERHLAAYLRLIDADNEGLDWRETTAAILGVNAATDPQRAKAMHDSHLARARWMTEIGYAHLLGCARPANR